MKVLDRISFSLDDERIMAEARVTPGSRDAGDLCSLIARAREAGRPKAAYEACFVGDRDKDGVRIGRSRFVSRMLAHNLASVERVFPFVVTCGHELDLAFSGNGDMLHEFWWGLIKSRLLAAANGHLRRHLHAEFRLEKTAVMHPGSGDAAVWPLEQQRQLFSLLGDVEEAIGVRLTDSFLMIPDKTTSGLLFPAEIEFNSCEVCRREKCPSRRTGFNQALWEKIRCS